MEQAALLPALATLPGIELTTLVSDFTALLDADADGNG